MTGMECNQKGADVHSSPAESAYIVLPPGHGKSWHHQRFHFLYEADSVVNCKGTDQLAQKRIVAKQTGDWRDYDLTWTNELKKRLPDTPYLIMVPSDSVGQLLADKCIFKGVLSIGQWEQNLSTRKGSVDKYSKWREEVLNSGAKLFDTNDALNTALYAVINMWCEGKI